MPLSCRAVAGEKLCGCYRVNTALERNATHDIKRAQRRNHDWQCGHVRPRERVQGIRRTRRRVFCFYRDGHGGAH